MIFFILGCIFGKSLFAQVAINETTVSDAVTFYIGAQRIPNIAFGGFLMPRVTEAQQASIPVSTTSDRDDGLMVYVSDPMTGKQCWEIYDGVAHTWRSIYCANSPCTGAVLYSEDFSSYVAGTGVTGASSSNGNYPTGVTKWTLTSFDSFGSTTEALPGTLINSNDYAQIFGGIMEFKDTNGLFVFETQTIDISGYSNIQVSMDIGASGPLEYDAINHVDDYHCGETENDYVDIEYSTNGGATFTEIPNFAGNGNSNHTLINNLSSTTNVSFSGISGSSLILRVRLQNWADDEYYYLDNIIVTCN
ncbi:MAG: hypothetical protein CMC74_03455 [Flavobacteriaceae bacterium]|nr:hypothetical protein [Flavobacteriaceae bacterium]|tara:strand:- start:37047 stop:37961 length:915 start_codon:yes stop_codon:yes gene_type:complete